jgi:methyl-accepting chemotaxis protein
MREDIKFRFFLITGIVILMMAVCCILSVNLIGLKTQVEKKQEIRYDSYVVAMELRQSSEDLTKLARTFVATDDPKYEKEYMQILSWRGGKTPRPTSFTLHPGDTINQLDIMKELGFSDQEFAKLSEATKNSNDLVATEVKAMNAIHGFEPDGKSPYSGTEPAQKMALRIMFDDKYHADKATIMAPIDEFFTLLNDRTLSDVRNANEQMTILANILIIIQIITALIYALTAWYVIRNVVSPLKTAENNLDRIARGDLNVTWVTPRKDEIGHMAVAFSQMVEGLRQKASVAQAISKGDLGIYIKADSEDQLGQSMIIMKEVILTLVNEINAVNAKIVAGDINIRADTIKFNGEFLKVAEGINLLLDTIGVPLKEAMRLSGSYAQGIYTDQISPHLVMNDDFIPFKEALNQIGIQGSQAIGGVKNEIKSLSAGMKETNASAEVVASTASVLAQGASSVSTLAEKSGNGIKQTLTAMEDLSHTVSEVATKAEQASAMAKQTVDLSEKGVILAGKTEKGMEGIMHSVDETGTIIADITNQMGEIGKIVGVITGIADQTGLLALNAAIEAARAGEAGMGFAVVADEVKSLALESQKSAENIATIIGNLQKKSELASESMKTSATEVKIGNDAVKETLQVFNQIVQAIDIVHMNMTEVAGATEEQAAAVEEITASVTEFGSLVQKTEDEAMSSAVATEQVNASIHQITKAISEAAASIQKISVEMERFTVS